MEIFLVSNNLYEDGISYMKEMDIESKKLTRPLSVDGEKLAQEISTLNEFDNITLIYSSMYASALSTAKYLSERWNKEIIVSDKLNDCKVGILGNKSLKNIKFMQNHDFDIKLTNGESLNEVGSRINEIINHIIYINNNMKSVVFTHKRTILGYLIKYGEVGYNLDDNLIIEYNDKVIYNEEDNDVDIIKLTFEDKKLVDIDVINV